MGFVKNAFNLKNDPNYLLRWSHFTRVATTLLLSEITSMVFKVLPRKTVLKNSFVVVVIPHGSLLFSIL